MKSISVIIPVYNEAANVAALHRETQAALVLLHLKFEIIFVNDGSTDGTLECLKALPDITIVDLSRNYGQAAALHAGFATAQGDILASMDGDGQNDPRDLKQMIESMETDGLDVVAGWRRKRQDPPGIRILTRIGRALRHALLSDPIHDSGCTLRVYTRAAAQSLDIGGEMHRYIVALLRFKGYRIGEVEVNHRPRQNGASKYGPSKAVRGFIDLVYIWFIYKYSARPLHLFGYLAMASVALGAAASAWTLYLYAARAVHFARDVWVAASLFFFVAAILFFSFGIVLDLLLRIHADTSPYERRYMIRDIIKT